MRWAVILLIGCGSTRPPAEPAHADAIGAYLVDGRIGEPPTPMRDMDACRERLAAIEVSERQQHEQRWRAELAELRRTRDKLDAPSACVTPCPDLEADRAHQRELVDQRIRNFHEPVFMLFHRCVENEPMGGTTLARLNRADGGWSVIRVDGADAASLRMCESLVEEEVDAGAVVTRACSTESLPPMMEKSEHRMVYERDDVGPPHARTTVIWSLGWSDCKRAIPERQKQQESVEAAGTNARTDRRRVWRCIDN